MDEELMMTRQGQWCEKFKLRDIFLIVTGGEERLDQNLICVPKQMGLMIP